jgi:hypothetical protein
MTTERLHLGYIGPNTHEGSALPYTFMKNYLVVNMSNDWWVIVDDEGVTTYVDKKDCPLWVEVWM